MTIKGLATISAASSAAPSPPPLSPSARRAARPAGGPGVARARGAPDRGLVHDVGERLLPGPDDTERRSGRFDVGDARARRNQAEVGVANRRNGRGADAGGGIDERQGPAPANER